MLNIVICEDEEIVRKKIAKSLEAISIKHDLELNLCLSSEDPVTVLNFIKDNKVDVLLLDIDLKNPNYNGISLGDSIRRFDKNVIIIFLSARLEKIFETFSCIPFDFIPKPAINPHLEETILRIFENKFYLPHGNFIKIKNNIINLDEIIYIEKQLMKSLFITPSGTIEIYISFINLLNCLPDYFMQVSKSFIINKNYITNINCSSKNILLKTNYNITYSNKYFNASEVQIEQHF